MSEYKYLMLHRNYLIGEIANFATRQSPYLYPDNLLSALDQIDQKLTEIFAQNEWLEFESYKGLYRFLMDNISELPEVLKWNQRKNGNLSPVGFSSMYDKPDPDNDFIDLSALFMNVARTLDKEMAR